MPLIDFFRTLGGRQQPAGLPGAEEQPRPDMFSRMTGGLSRFNENHPGLVFGAGQMIQGNDLTPAFTYAAGVKKSKREQQAQAQKDTATRKFLMRQGYSPDEADEIIGSGQAAAFIKPPKSSADGADEFGLQVQTGVDENGNPVLIQVGKSGKAIRTAMPEGVTLSKAPIKLDAGTHFVLLDPITRQPIGQIPKENYQEAYDSRSGDEDAKAKAAAAQALPGAQGMAELIDSQIQSLKTDPYLPNMVGPTDSLLPNISGDAARVQSKIDQLQGGAFLQARQMLKGGGAITDIEGQKAEAAFVRMNQAQNDADFVQALDEFNAAVQQGLRKLQGQAGQAPPAAAGGGRQRLRYNPQTGELE